MKYAFFGTPRFAAIVLEKLANAGLEPALVVCNPDRPVGRKQIVTAPPTKILAQAYKIPVWQPEKIHAGEAKEKLAGMDFAVVAAYAKILPDEILKLPRLGMVGVHPSLLPKYRGTTPIQNAILGGEAETGTTLFMLDAKVDHGATLASAKVALTNSETYTELERILAELSGNLLVDTLPKFNTGSVDAQVQDESKATFTKKFKTEDGFVDILAEDDTAVDRKIRALNPEPGAYTLIKEARIKILDRGTVQYEGKRAQKVKDALVFLRTLLLQ
jgi:methionyl-tRNA formyltransferase